MALVSQIQDALWVRASGTASDRRRTVLVGLRPSAANDFAAMPPGEQCLGAERLRVHLTGHVDPNGPTHLTLRTIGGLVSPPRRPAVLQMS
jgi:hypothetical protein